jgi:hypothetical protein
MEEAAMSLSARDRQALDSIEDQLSGSDPRLASLMATFTRLASDEAMPPREDIRAGGPPPPDDEDCDTGAETPRALLRRTGRRLSPQPALYLLWLTVAITLITVTLVIKHGGGTAPCTQSWLAACARQAPAHNPRRGLPGAGRTSGHPPAARPAAGLEPATDGRTLVPDAVAAPSGTRSSSRTG